jgi:hypothetical protein
MIKLFNILAILVLLFNVVNVSAQTASPAPGTGEPVDEVSDLQFPIEDLGGCEDYKSCLTFCDDPVNNATCIDFAKKNGFYKDDPILAPTDEFMTKAKDVLGCETPEACATLCFDTANFEKCDAFAKSQGMLGGYVEEPDKPEFLEVAQDVLGCSDGVSCITFCDDPANADQCDQFADQVGLLGGEVPVGPGGCNTPETCQSFCSDPNNFQTCQAFDPGDGNFTGPGGCNSPESCRNHCEENPAECRSYAPGSNGVYVPVACPQGQFFGPSGVCTANEKTQEAGSCAQGGKYWDGGSCQDNAPAGIHPTVGGAFFQPRPEMGGCATPGTCYDYCSANPGKCGGFSSNSERPKEDYIPSLYYTPGTEVKFTPKADMGGCSSPGGCYDYCKENPGKCGGFDAKAPRPVDTYLPGTYYTPPTSYTYFTPPATSFYVTPMYFTPPAGSTYTSPSYYTPGMYSTPSYYTPSTGSSYTTPTYYTPGTYVQISSTGQYPTPTYNTPTYYTPPLLASYNTPTYYTPAQYITPTYFTPPAGSNYTTPPAYITPPAYTTPQYYTPYTGGNYTTPVYYTPPAGSNYTTPSYSSPSYYYPTPTGGYTTPTYPTPPAGSTYTSPTYYTPGGSYYYPSPTGSYASPSYYYPTPGSTGYPTPYYPTPASYSYPTPGSGYTYPSPGYITPGSYYNTPGSGYTYPSPPDSSYVTPTGYSYPTPSTYATPPYSTPPAYGTPADSYTTPAYGTPPEYPTPSVQGVSKEQSFFEMLVDFFRP